MTEHGEEFGQLATDVRYTRQAVDELARKIEPLLLARSGDLAALANLERGITSAHEKIRGQSARTDSLEKRFDQAKWLVVGGFAVVQFLWDILGEPILKALGLGG